MVGRRHREPLKLRRLSPECNELLRLWEWQRSQHNGIDDAEDSRCGPDAKRQREHGHSCEARVFEKLPKGVSKVVVHRCQVLGVRGFGLSFISSLVTHHLSLGSQRLHWIDLGCAPSRNQTGEKGDQSKQQCYRGKCAWISRVNLIELISQNSRQR